MKERTNNNVPIDEPPIAPTVSIGIIFTLFLGILSAMVPFSMDMYLPDLPKVAMDFHASASLTQLTIGGFMIGSALGTLIIGPLSDGLGRKRPLCGGLLIFTLASIGCMYVTSVGELIALRFVQGLAGAAGMISPRSISTDLAKGPALTKLLAVLMFVNGFAPVIAPLIGGQIVRFYSWRMIFAVLAVLGAVMLIGSLCIKESLPPARRIKGGFSRNFAAFTTLLKKKYVLGHCLLQAFVFMAFFGYLSGSAFLFQRIYGTTPQEYSYFFFFNSVGIVLGSALVTRLVHHFTEYQMMRFTLWWTELSLVAFSLAVILQAPLWVTAATLFCVVSPIAAFGTVTFAAVLQRESAFAGSVTALLSFFGTVCAGLSAPLVGIAGDSSAVPMAATMLISQSLGLFVFYKFIRPEHISGH